MERGGNLVKRFIYLPIGGTNWIVMYQVANNLCHYMGEREGNLVERFIYLPMGGN